MRTRGLPRIVKTVSGCQGVLIAAYTLKERVTQMRFAAALLIVAGAIVIKAA